MKSPAGAIRRMSLRSKLIASYLLLLLLPLSLLGGFASVSIERLLVEQSRAAYQETVRQTALNMQNIMDNYQASAEAVRGNERLLSALRTLRIRPLTLGEEYDSYNQIRAHKDAVLFQPGIQRVRLAVNGDATFVKDMFEIFSLDTLQGDDAWPMMQQRVSWLKSDAFSTIRLDDPGTFQLCLRINDTAQSALLGYLLVEIDAQALLQPLDSLHLPAGAHLILQDGQQVIHSASGLMASREELQPENYLSLSAPLSYGEWSLTLSIPHSGLSRPGDSLPYTILIMAAVLSVVGILFALGITRSISRRLRMTIQGIQRIEGGELGVTIPVVGGDEYAQVQTAFNGMSLRIQALVDDVLQSQAQQKHAEMRLLYEQINPHFVYNTLDIIRWEALRNRSAPLAELADMLVGYLRLSLNHGQEMIQVSREVDMIGRYMHIMNYRYQDAIAYSADIAPEILEVPVTKMVLQPLVENAVLHGIMGTRAKRGLIHVRGWREADTLLFAVMDDGAGMAQAQVDSLLSVDSDHYGMRNVQQRLAAYYGGDSGLRIDSTPGKGTTVTVVMRGAV